MIFSNLYFYVYKSPECVHMLVVDTGNGVEIDFPVCFFYHDGTLFCK